MLLIDHFLALNLISRDFFDNAWLVHALTHAFAHAHQHFQQTMIGVSILPKHYL